MEHFKISQEVAVLTVALFVAGEQLKTFHCLVSHPLICRILSGTAIVGAVIGTSVLFIIFMLPLIHSATLCSVWS